jgi:hypothetical protein
MKLIMEKHCFLKYLPINARRGNKLVDKKENRLITRRKFAEGC